MDHEGQGAGEKEAEGECSEADEAGAAGAAEGEEGEESGKEHAGGEAYNGGPAEGGAGEEGEEEAGPGLAIAAVKRQPPRQSRRGTKSRSTEKLMARPRSIQDALGHGGSYNRRRGGRWRIAFAGR